MNKLLFVLCCCLGLAACQAGSSAPAEEGGDIQLATEVSIFESKDSQKKWVLTAETVDFSGLQSATLKHPRLLLKQNGADSAQITGKTGTFDYPNKLVSIEGKGKVESFEEDVKITAERFFYDVDKDRVWSDVKTVVTRGSARVTARGGIETNSKLTKIELKKQSTRLPKTTGELRKKS